MNQLRKIILGGVLIIVMAYIGFPAAHASIVNPFATPPVSRSVGNYINVQAINSSAQDVSSALNGPAASSLWGGAVSWVSVHLGINLPKFISAVQSFFSFLIQQTLTIIHSIK